MQKQITLNPGQSEIVAFTIVPNAAGIYQATLDGLSGSFEALFKFGTIVDPNLANPYPGGSLPSGLKNYDCFPGAELSAYTGVRNNYIPSIVTAKYEFYLIKAAQATLVGSCQRSIPANVSLGEVGIYITIPGSPGTYDTMLRTYINDVLTGQYPYLGPITVVPKGVSHFSYTTPSLVVAWDSWWPSYTYAVTDTITNTGGTTETRNVILWLRRNYGISGSNQWYRKHEFTLTLAPGGSYSYSHLPKHDTSDQYWDRVPMAGGENLLAQLRDSDGGVSSKSSTRTAT